MREGWSYKKLGEVCDIINGKNQKMVENPNGAYPIMGSGGIMGYADDYLCLEGTTIIGRKGTINKPIYVDTKFWNVDTAFGLQPKDNNNCRFVFYLCKSIDFTRYDKGVTIPSLVKSDLLQIKVSVPPLSTQQQIVEELDLLSGIIEKQKAQLKELDNLAQSLFYDMFGDPVTNEKGWEVKKFGDVYKLKSGDGLSAKQFIEGPYPVYGGNGIAGCHNKYNKDGDCIIIGRVGLYCGNVRNVKGKFWLTDNAFLLFYDDNKQSPVFVTFLLNYLDLHQYANHAAQPVISNLTLKDVSIIFPPLTLQRQFAERVVSIEHQKSLIQQSLKETETLFNSRMDYYFN